MKRLLDSTQSLPGIAAGQRRHLMQVAFDGRLAATAWESESGLGFVGLWVLDVDAGTPPVQVVIDRFPDGSPGFFGLSALVVHDGAIYFNAGNASGYSSVHRWKEGVVTTLLGDTRLVEAAGGMFGVDPFNLHVDQGGVFAYAFMNGDNARIPVVAETDGKVNWLLARKIDGHRAKFRFGGAMVLGASEGRVAAWVPFENPSPTLSIYVNADPVLHATRSESGGLHLELPARTLLQRAGTPGGPWSESSEGNAVPGSARGVEVRPDGPAAYFRLVETPDQ